MTTWKGERNGVKGTYLDGPFFPRFFPDTPEGKARLSRQIDADIKRAIRLLIGFSTAWICVAVFFGFVLAAR